MEAQNDATFHAGECAVQERVGVRDKLAAVGRNAIRDFMPDQHRAFFAQLPFVVAGSVDAHGQPWASVLANPPGFIHSPDARRLDVRAHPLTADPLRRNLAAGAPIGLLGIEPHTRRRNRVNGVVAAVTEAGFSVRVDQSFGNCPKYIQTRELRGVAGDADAGIVVRSDRLDCEARKIIQCADTFFIASHFGADPCRREHGIDVSHRGGLRGFVRILDDRSLEFPDYRGNFLFNTLGNLAVNPRCGLLFVSFTRGDVVQMTGSAEILWEVAGGDPALEGADRVVRFRTEAMVRAAGAFPLRADLGEYAPQLLTLCQRRKG